MNDVDRGGTIDVDTGKIIVPVFYPNVFHSLRLCKFVINDRIERWTEACDTRSRLTSRLYRSLLCVTGQKTIGKDSSFKGRKRSNGCNTCNSLCALKLLHVQMVFRISMSLL